MITTSDILNSFSPERRKRIEEGARVIIAELGLDKHSNKNLEDSLKDTLLLQNNEIHHPYVQKGANPQV
ncbi:MAG: hypothetical protein IJU76_08285 [Desulfovibrionaceae bacterium]|nr:hypothetical protein [Desulfovibrionaceae bacterium]